MRLRGIPEQTSCVSCSVMSDPLQPKDCGQPGSSVHGIFQARLWSGLPFRSPEDLPNPRTEPTSPTPPALQADPLPAEPSGKPERTLLVMSGFQFLMKRSRTPAWPVKPSAVCLPVRAPCSCCHPALAHTLSLSLCLCSSSLFI